MSETNVNVAGDFGASATKLVERISDAIGGIAKPWQIKRVANAEAQAEIIKAEAQIKITELERRAIQRLIREEAQKQENIEAITLKSLPLLDVNSDPSRIEDDWIVHFFDRCRSISDGEMQQIWAQLLSSESKSAGSVSKRTVDILASLDKIDAELFSKLALFSIDTDNSLIAIYDKNHNIYVDQGLGFQGLTHLMDIGLISFDYLSGFVTQQKSGTVSIDYRGKVVGLTLIAPEFNLEIGNVRLTQVGHQLLRSIEPVMHPDFLEYLISVWTQKGYNPVRQLDATSN